MAECVEFALAMLEKNFSSAQEKNKNEIKNSEDKLLSLKEESKEIEDALADLKHLSKKFENGT